MKFRGHLLSIVTLSLVLAGACSKKGDDEPTGDGDGDAGDGDATGGSGDGDGDEPATGGSGDGDGTGGSGDGDSSGGAGGVGGFGGFGGLGGFAGGGSECPGDLCAEPGDSACLDETVFGNPDDFCIPAYEIAGAGITNGCAPEPGTCPVTMTEGYCLASSEFTNFASMSSVDEGTRTTVTTADMTTFSLFTGVSYSGADCNIYFEIADGQVIPVTQTITTSSALACGPRERTVDVETDFDLSNLELSGSTNPMGCLTLTGTLSSGAIRSEVLDMIRPVLENEFNSKLDEPRDCQWCEEGCEGLACVPSPEM